MNKYELKELKVLLEVGILRGENSSSYKELYNKVIEEIGENIEYPHIAKVMIERGWMKQLDKDGYLGVDANGRKRYETNPYYILTNKGLKELENKKKRYNRYPINWDRIVSVVSLLKEGLMVVIRWFT